MKKFSILAIFFFLVFCLLCFGLEKADNQLRVIPLYTKGERSVNIVRKGENSIVLHSGFVNLKKGESIGRHNSKSYEELIIVLKGIGRFETEGREPLVIKEGEALYSPPFSEHNVTNIGDEDLKYVYVVADTKEKEGLKDAHSGRIP